MYHFAVVALLALATLKIADLLEELIPALGRVHTLLLLALAVAGTVIINYSMFAGFHIVLRQHWMGPWFTGFVVGSLATVWRVAFGWLGSAEGKTVEERQPRRPKMAA